MSELTPLQRWRVSIPWNNAQIEIALREEAAVQPNAHMRARYLGPADYLARTRHFSMKTLRTVIHRLIKTCAVCGATALYRIGYEGRCQIHRLEGVAAARAKKEMRLDAQAAGRAANDRRLRSVEDGHQRARQVKGGRRGVERPR